MLVNIKNLLAVAQKDHFAISAFDIGGDQLLKVVMKKVGELDSPVILEISPDEFNFVGDAQIQVMIYEAAQTDMSVCIRLDHEDFCETAVRAIRASMTSIMIGASTLPYEENVAVMKKVVETAYIANVSVELELGTIGTTGNSIEDRTQGVIYTVPEETKRFIEDTGVDTFAVTTDTACGIYPKDMRPEPHIGILEDITNKVDVPLVLRGGSSDKDEEIAATVNSSICKINISSNIRVILYTQCRKTLDENPDYRKPLEIYPEAMEVYGKIVKEEIRLFKLNNKMKYYY